MAKLNLNFDYENDFSYLLTDCKLNKQTVKVANRREKNRDKKARYNHLTNHWQKPVAVR